MNAFFLDASALAKRYGPEPGSDLVDLILDRVGPTRLACLMIGAAEVLSVLVRRRNGGRLAPELFTQGLVNFQAEVLQPGGISTLPVSNEEILGSLPFIERFSINATDAVVLRVALDLAADLRAAGDDLVLVASDQRLLRAAADEGLATFNPETGTETELDALIGGAGGVSTSAPSSP